MKNQDNIFDQFKNAAEKSETKDFSGLEKVWSRVDAKLDTQVYKTQRKTNSGWKKFAVAASVVVGTVFAYQFLQKNKTTQPVQNVSEIKESESMPVQAQTEDTTVITKDSVPSVIVTEQKAERTKEKHINSIAQAEINKPETEKIESDTIVLAKPVVIETKKEHENKKESSPMLRGKAFEAVSVKHIEPEKPKKETEKRQQVAKKAPPLVVVDGMILKDNQSAGHTETFLELDEPLYIVNGVEYSEKEMFGPNPTSPYYPLNKQEIESLVIYEGKEAIEKFGQKGNKGVVVVKTKDGKPLKSTK